MPNTDTFENLITSIITSPRRDDIFEYLLLMNDESDSDTIPEVDTLRIVMCSRMDVFFDKNLNDGNFDINNFIRKLDVVEKRLRQQGETFYNKLFILFRLMLDNDKYPTEEVLVFLNKLYKDYNY